MNNVSKIIRQRPILSENRPERILPATMAMELAVTARVNASRGNPQFFIVSGTAKLSNWLSKAIKHNCQRNQYNTIKRRNAVKAP